jgi:hypothetical protein
VYNQGNILGTVSESSGVPTGAIIESGSNANGQFVKYADGTMICSYVGSLTSPSTGRYSQTYPAEFVSTPAVSGGTTYTSVDIRNVRSMTPNSGTSTIIWRFLVKPLVDATTTSQESVSTLTGCHLIAVGRWF